MRPSPSPDFGRLRQVLLRQGEPDRVPFVELFADDEVMAAVTGEPVPSPMGTDRASRDRMLDWRIRFWYETGYDYVSVGPTVRLPHNSLVAEDTAPLRREQRRWQDESIGVISGWGAFEQYPWPQPHEIDYYSLEYIGRHLPEGMQVIAVADPGGQLELMTALMGFTGLALALSDDPPLVQAVAQRVEELLVTICAAVVEIPGVGALWLGDDLGYKTATMISPADLRRYVFPCHRRLAAIAHSHGLPFLLHACGNLREVMCDLIDDVGIDARHSFEDAIEPVGEAKRRYGDRIALLGGIDVDLLCRAGEDDVRTYTRRTIEQCAPGGGWALGTGNSVANYVPVRNYLAMLDEGRKCGVYR
jgi:uroporphyrinogen decarboxylase